MQSGGDWAPHYRTEVNVPACHPNTVYQLVCSTPSPPPGGEVAAVTIFVASGVSHAQTADNIYVTITGSAGDSPEQHLAPGSKQAGA